MHLDTQDVEFVYQINIYMCRSIILYKNIVLKIKLIILIHVSIKDYELI